MSRHYEVKCFSLKNIFNANNVSLKSCVTNISLYLDELLEIMKLTKKKIQK